jgi:hypothetical protein
MKRLIAAFALAAAVTTVMLVVGGTTAGADNNAALVINNQGCTLLSYLGVPSVIADSDHTVVNMSKGNLVCKVSGVANPTGHAVTFVYPNPAILCNVLHAGTTNVWTETISKSGNATLNCHYPPTS